MPQASHRPRGQAQVSGQAKEHRIVGEVKVDVEYNAVVIEHEEPRLPSTKVRVESMLMAMPSWSRGGQSAAVCGSGVRTVPPVAE
jgi:hypothetical protein